jgi:succinate-semialdehyde dehydrogenase/glutarate-semialdehyde dehydrogenase
MAMRTTNPTTGAELATYPEHTPAAIDRTIRAVHAAGHRWRVCDFTQRAAVLSALAERLRTQRESLAQLMAVEMGKPVAQGRLEIDKCAWACECNAQHAAAWLALEQVPTDARRSFVVYQPLGVVLAVMPWNFPFWQVFRCAGPALMAGNALLLKHASNVTGCALAIENLFHEVDGAADLLRTVLVPGAEVLPLLDRPEIRGVAFTGSGPAGQAIAARAGAALKKSVLELGGSDPYLVLEDADLDHAAATCVASRLINGGQSCIAAKRFIVVEATREAFETRVIARMADQQVGDPRAETTTIGPLARADLRDELQAQVDVSIERGAALALGGNVPPGPGAFYPPTVLTGVRPGMPAFDEETFGPVAAICPVRDQADAVELANRSRLGLGAAVFTRDPERGERVALALEAGSCFVNTFVRSDPRLPFGGIKDSGYGRELGVHGIREFVNIKTVYLA